MASRGGEGFFLWRGGEVLRRFSVVAEIGKDGDSLTRCFLGDFRGEENGDRERDLLDDLRCLDIGGGG